MSDNRTNSDGRVPMRIGPDRDKAKIYLVGGGIASMAAAVFMIRDGDVLGRNITILEETDRLGGSLDGAGSAVDGYVLRGGRMIERKYLCTYDLFSAIPRSTTARPSPRKSSTGTRR